MAIFSGIEFRTWISWRFYQLWYKILWLFLFLFYVIWGTKCFRDILLGLGTESLKPASCEIHSTTFGVDQQYQILSKSIALLLQQIDSW